MVQVTTSPGRRLRHLQVDLLLKVCSRELRSKHDPCTSLDDHDTGTPPVRFRPVLGSSIRSSPSTPPVSSHPLPPVDLQRTSENTEVHSAALHEVATTSGGSSAIHRSGETLQTPRSAAVHRHGSAVRRLLRLHVLRYPLRGSTRWSTWSDSLTHCSVLKIQGLTTERTSC